MKDFAGKRVLVVGLGKSGIAAVRFLVAAGAVVTAADIKSANVLGESIKTLKNLPVKFAFGQHEESLFNEADIIIPSPGVPLDLPGIACARVRGVAVIGEMELAARLIDRPVIAITGTNGKTTTTALLGHLLRKSGIDVCVAGNIGTALLDVVDEAQEAKWVVLEVSSFQIETTQALTPQIAILLNVTPDHLDRHFNFEAYVECKASLVKRVPSSGWGIYNAADENVTHSMTLVDCQLMPFDATGKIFRQNDERPRAWFGAGSLWVSTDNAVCERYPMAQVKLEGMHNRENMLAALAAAHLCGAKSHKLLAALESFHGLPHRVQLVGEYGGVRYYDDSKGTNIGATIRAIEGFAEPIVLIAGGLSKGVDFTPLALCVPGRVKKAILIGESAPILEDLLSSNISTTKASSMEEAVNKAVQAADPGDVVLLSPACASFDMFRDYAHRGDEFTKAVKRIAGKSKSA